LMMRFATRPRSAMSKWKKSAVTPSTEVTARSACLTGLSMLYAFSVFLRSKKKLQSVPFSMIVCGVD
jgi:hypothetical protein